MYRATMINGKTTSGGGSGSSNVGGGSGGCSSGGGGGGGGMKGSRRKRKKWSAPQLSLDRQSDKEVGHQLDSVADKMSRELNVWSGNGGVVASSMSLSNARKQNRAEQVIEYNKKK